MKFFFPFIFLAFFQPVTAQKQIVVDPDAQVRTLEGSFRSVKVSQGIDLYFSQSGEYALAVSASRAKDVDQITTEIVNGVLRIGLKDKSIRLGRHKFRVYLSAPELDMLDASSASDVVIAGTLAAKSIHLKISSASNFRGEIIADQLIVDASGASDVYLKGKVTAVKFDASGASDIKAFDLIASGGEVDASGASDIQVTMNGKLSAEASGASHIKYRGNTTLTRSEISGASKIQKGK